MSVLCVFKGYVETLIKDFWIIFLRSRKQLSKESKLLVEVAEFQCRVLPLILCPLAKHFVSMDLEVTSLQS